MELESKAVQVADVERAKVMVKGIVEQRVVDREVVRLLACAGGFGCGGGGSSA